MIKIMQGDAEEVLKELPDKIFDIIITSPPYNLGNKHHTRSKFHKQYEDDMDEVEYQKKQKRILRECFRVLKDDGSLWYNHKNRIRDGAQISPYEWLLDLPFTIKQEIVWVNGSPNFDKIRFYPFTERLYWLTKSPKTKMFNTISHHDVFDRTEWKAMGTKGSFTRAFPPKMVEDLLSCFPDSKMVLDPFAGSGTVLEVAERMGKDSIGIELEPEHCKMIESRLNSRE